MNDRVQEFFKDLTIFFTDLIILCNRQTIHGALVGQWRSISQDNYRKIPLLLTMAFHLAVLLFAIGAPFIMFTQTPRIPEVYTVNLFNAQEVAPPPVTRVVKITIPAQKKAVAPRPVKKAAVSLSPIRQQLEREMKEKKARKKQKELQLREMEQVKLDLLREQAENEAKQAEEDLAEAKKEVALKISDLYKTGDYESRSNQRYAVESAKNSTRKGENDRHKLEALEKYRARLFEHISPHWQLPELQEWDESLRVVILMQVKRDGTIINSYFEKRSKNLRFNQYAKKAIDNAQPLPPFPIDFNEKSEEIAVTFSPGGLF